MRALPFKAITQKTKRRWIGKDFVNRHPSAADYADFGDFSFYTFALKRAHLVAGFGRIHWVENTHICFDLANLAALADVKADILAHMNTDHAGAVTLCAQLAGVEPGPWVMTGIDPEGLDLRTDGQVARLNFEVPIQMPTPRARH